MKRRISMACGPCWPAWILAGLVLLLSPSTSLAIEVTDPWTFQLKVTTFAIDFEKQGLEDNTFIKGIGRDTTLMGNLITVTAMRRLTPTLGVEMGIFATMPFGHAHEMSAVRPVARLTYTPVPGVTGTFGTLQGPHDQLFDAVFDDSNRFVRPLEQGGQVRVDLPWYRQDLFANWEQTFGGFQPKRYDVGYAGQLRFDWLRFNGQVHLVENGRAYLKLDRSFDTRQNLVTAAGPELALQPSRYLPVPEWWREIGVRVQYLTSRDDPNAARGGDTTRGRGYEAQAWVDLDGWRSRIGFWRGRHFISQQGDPEYRIGNFTEVGLTKTISITEGASLEFGGQVRKMSSFTSGQVQGVRYVNQAFFALNWSLDSRRDPLADLFAWPSPVVSDTPTAAERRLTVKLDTLAYAYNVQFPGVDRVNGRALPNPTYLGAYAAPVLYYQMTPRLTVVVGVFLAAPVGSLQPHHAVQPIMSGQYQLAERSTMTAGTIDRNHPLLDAVFDDAMLFRRPIEQGFQWTVARPSYRQDLFINWYQVETSAKPERFDVGYAGQWQKSVFQFNGQLYWAHDGGAQFSESRQHGGLNRTAYNNFQIAFGPGLSVHPGEYASSLAVVREIEVAAYYLTDRDEPTPRAQAMTYGRGYLLTAGVNVAGWRPYLSFWRGEHFVSAQGDPAYAAHHFTEYGVVKDLVLRPGLTARIGALARTIEQHVTHTEYLMLNWSWDQSPWRGFCQRQNLLHREESPCAL